MVPKIAGQNKQNKTHCTQQVNVFARVLTESGGVQAIEDLAHHGEGNAAKLAVKITRKVCLAWGNSSKKQRRRAARQKQQYYAYFSPNHLQPTPTHTVRF